MTTALVVTSLEELMKLLEVVGAKAEAGACGAIAATLQMGDPKKKVAEFLKSAEPMSELPSPWTGVKVRKVLPALSTYREGLNILAPKAGKELSMLVEFLERFEHADVEQLLDAMRVAVLASAAKKDASAKKKASRAGGSIDDAVVTRYAEALKAVLGREPEFDDVMLQLKADKSVRNAELAEIAKRLLPYPPSKTDRKQSVKAIEDYQLAARGLDLKLKATHGRSAA